MATVANPIYYQWPLPWLKLHQNNPGMEKWCCDWPYLCCWIKMKDPLRFTQLFFLDGFKDMLQETLKKKNDAYMHTHTHTCIHIWIHLMFSIKEKACRLWVAHSRSSCTLEFFYGWYLAVIPLPCVGSLGKINTLASLVAVLCSLTVRIITKCTTAL